MTNGKRAKNTSELDYYSIPSNHLHHQYIMYQYHNEQNKHHYAKERIPTQQTRLHFNRLINKNRELLADELMLPGCDSTWVELGTNPTEELHSLTYWNLNNVCDLSSK